MRGTDTMIQLATSLMEHSPLAALIALEPMSYVIRTLFFIAAFSSAMKIESVVGRAVGFCIMIITASGLLLVGVRAETIVDIVLAICAFAAAGYSWWYTRV